MDTLKEQGPFVKLSELPGDGIWFPVLGSQMIGQDKVLRSKKSSQAASSKIREPQDLLQQLLHSCSWPVHCGFYSLGVHLYGTSQVLIPGMWFLD